MSDKEMHLNIDDNNETLKKMHYLEILKRMDEVMDSNQTCINMSKITMKDEEMLSTYKRILRATSIEHDRSTNDCKHVPMIKVATIDNDASAMNDDKVKRERSFKPCMNLSTRRKIELLS